MFFGVILLWHVLEDGEILELRAHSVTHAGCDDMMKSIVINKRRSL